MAFFDAISESEKVQSINMMTLEKKDGSAFEELITHPQIKNVTYDYSLEQLQWSYQNKDITCFISFLPIQTSHIQLSKGRLPQK